MPFALDSNPDISEVSEAINYLLANFGPNLSADPVTGQIAGPQGIVVGYLYRYMAVKYSDSADGSVNFSNTPTNRQYYGLRNSDDTVESTNPADYIWYKAAGGFGTSKFLFYQTTGGRAIQFVVATTSPALGWGQDTGVSIDLDIITAVTLTASATPTIYKWTNSSTPPARPTTTTTYTWSTGSYTAPSTWFTTAPSDTTPGDYLWAITIPIVANSTTTTTVLDWTNTSYTIRAISYNGTNGSTGATGPNGLNAITAYLVQSQSASPPGGFPQTTTGSSAPTGWSLTAPSVAVGQVLWYSQGQYNNSTVTINGIASNTTYWNTPVAASIFQDIRSDNWNGSTPPVYGTPSTYGTQGYYISRNTGNCYFNDGVFRADISTDGDAVFQGRTLATFTIPINGVIYNIDYSSLANGTSASGGNVRAGHVGYVNALTGAAYNVGLMGIANNGVSIPGIGVVGSGGSIGGYFINATSTGSGLECSNTGGGAALRIDSGTFAFGSYTIAQPAGSTTTFLRNDGSWSTALVTAPTNSGTATASAGAINFLGSTSTGIAGAYIGVTGSGNTVTFGIQTTSPSDIRLKEEIQEIDIGLSFVKSLRPVSYKLKADPRHQKGYGFIAQEVEQLVGNETSLVYFEPDWQVGDEKGFNTIHYPSYIAVLTKAVQELTAKVEALEAKLQATKA